MVRKRIVWSSRAKKELKEILGFFNHRNNSTSYSNKILNEIDEHIEVIQENYNIGRPTNNNITKVIPLGVYLLFYEVYENEIWIVSFWDNRQKLKNRLF